jgi:glutathione S-transferase
MNWFYLSFRKHHEAITRYKVFAPMVGIEVKEWDLARAEEAYPNAMQALETILTNSEFVAGDEISIADMYAVA